MILDGKILDICLQLQYELLTPFAKNDHYASSWLTMHSKQLPNASAMEQISFEVLKHALYLLSVV